MNCRKQNSLNRINSLYPINTRNHSPLFQRAWKKCQTPKVQVAAAVESLITLTFVLWLKLQKYPRIILVQALVANTAFIPILTPLENTSQNNSIVE